MDYTIFVSYASEDTSVANSVCESLEGSQLRCWIAPRDIVPGVDYPEAITEALEKCKVLVLLLSEHSNKSRHVLSEVSKAFDCDHPIIVLVLDSVKPAGKLEYYIRTSHWLDAKSQRAGDYLSKLLEAIRLFVPDLESNSATSDSTETNTISASVPGYALRVTAGHPDDFGTVFPLEKHRIIVGRASVADIGLRDSALSRVHMILLWDAENLTYNITETASATPVFVNRSILKGSRRLHDGDEIQTANSILIFQELES